MKHAVGRFTSFLVMAAGMALLALPSQAQTLTITNGLTLWLKADAITGLTNGQAVSIWNDSSTNAYDATQSDPAQQPTYLANIQNGLPVVRFNGLSPGTPPRGDELNTASIPSIASMSFFLVAKPFDALNRYTLAFGNDSHALVYGFFDSTTWYWYDGSSTALAPLNFTKFQIASHTAASSVTGSWAIGGNMGGGNSNPFNGDMSELIVFDRSLSITERQDVTEYLFAKWAIPEPSMAGLLGISALLLWRQRRS